MIDFECITKQKLRFHDIEGRKLEQIEIAKPILKNCRKSVVKILLREQYRKST